MNDDLQEGIDVEKERFELTDEQIDRVVGGNVPEFQHVDGPITSSADQSEWDDKEGTLFKGTGNLGDTLSLSSSSYDQDPWKQSDKQNYDSWMGETGGDLSRLNLGRF